MGDDGKLLDFFYASNQGDPLTVAKNALITMRNRYRDAGVTLEILGCGSTGYGELLFSRRLPMREPRSSTCRTSRFFSISAART